MGVRSGKGPSPAARGRQAGDLFGVWRTDETGAAFAALVALVVTSVASCSESTATDSDVAVCEPTRCPAFAQRAKPTLRVGIRPTDARSVADFQPFENKGIVPVVFGGNGAWMLTLAVATDGFDCCVDRVNVRASLTSIDCGRNFGMINLRRRPLVAGPDGLRYVFNVWLVVGDVEYWDGEEALLTVSVESYGGGETLEQTFTVTPKKAGSTDPALRMKIGTSEADELSPDGFCTLPTYSELTPLPLAGSDVGLVLAARTSALGAEVTEVDIDGTLTKKKKADRRCQPTPTESCQMLDVELGRITGRRHAVVRREDGQAYVLGVPLMLGSTSEWSNEVGSLTLSLTPAGGGDTLTGSAAIRLLAPMR